MASPVKLNLKIYQGSTFRETLRWESSTRVYKTITNISKIAPVQITASSHNIPEGWRFRVTGVQGMKEINCADNQYYTASPTDFNTVTVNLINAAAYSTYTSGGILEYNEPVDIAGVTARMHIREKLESPTPLLTLTTENGGIIVDNVTKTISLFIDDVATSELNFTSAVYSLELVKSGDVIPFVNGNISLVKEVTR